MQNAAARTGGNRSQDSVRRNAGDESLRISTGLVAGFAQSEAAKQVEGQSRNVASISGVADPKNDHERQIGAKQSATEQEGEHDEGDKLQCMHFDGTVSGDLDIEGSFDIALRCLRRHVFSEASVQLDREEQVIRRIQNTVERLREKGKVDAKEVESRIMRVSELISRARATMYMADTHCRDEDGPHARR